MEDYALRFTASHARRWSAFRVGNTALGAISFLACEAIGGAITLSFGFDNAIAAILAVGMLMFILGLPICLYATRYGVDVDLLTRGAGFGYIGSTVTSLIYASFTFILFAIEASIMSVAINQVLGIPPWFANVMSALLVVPIAFFGFRSISRLQVWTQPLWLLLQFGPLVWFAWRQTSLFGGWRGFAGIGAGHELGHGLALIPFGMAASVLLSLLPQIGEQVDYLRFLPKRNEIGTFRWWSTMLLAGPGWVVIGCAKLAAGSFLAYLAVTHGIEATEATQPATLYHVAFLDITGHPALAGALTLVFVVTCQIKINVTNAYAGSIAWSNFFSRLTHSHPGRVVWMIFNVLLALLLMEIGIFRIIDSILGLYANFAIGWMGALAADLMINKPLGFSPPGIEFKRAHLFDVNPVGIGAMGLSVLTSTAVGLGGFGAAAHALAPFAGLVVALVAAPAIAIATRGRTYIARTPPAADTMPSPRRCIVCENPFEAPDMAHCPAYGGEICSLCCSLDARCHDMCKPAAPWQTLLGTRVRAAAARFLPAPVADRIDRRITSFLAVFALLTLATGALLLLIGLEYRVIDPAERETIATTLWIVFLALFIIAGVIAWVLVLTQASRRAAEAESARQTAMLMDEIAAHERTDAALQTAKEAAESANIAKSRYMVGVIHEIRAPLNAISGYAQLLERAGTLDPQDAARIIRRSAEHLSNLVDGLLDISKIETGSLQLHRDRINLAEFLDQIVDMFRLQAAAKGIAFIDDRPSSLPRLVHTDANRLRQILLNLLSNAIKYTASGHVRLRLRIRSQVAVFEIEDTGCGIRAEDIDRIFEPFERGHLPAAHAVAGTGLGLTISKLLANVLGGEITVTSTEGQGSRFRLRLMLSEAAASDVFAPSDQRIAGYHGPRRTILLVDDDPAHIELMHEILDPLGFEVFAEPDGARGLSRALAIVPDLAILDVSMPGMSGWELASRLREEVVSKQMHIIMLSGNLHELPAAAASATVHDAFLAKPLDIRALYETIGRLLGIEWIEAPAEAPALRHPEAIMPTPAAPLSTVAPAVAPKPLAAADLRDLLELGRIGYLTGIEEKLAEIARKDPDRAGTVAYLGALVGDFALTRFTTLIEAWLEDADNDAGV